MDNKRAGKSQKMAGLLTTKQVSEILNMDRKTIEIKCREGVIPAIKIFRRWRVRRADIMRLVEGQRGEQ